MDHMSVKEQFMAPDPARQDVPLAAKPHAKRKSMANDHKDYSGTPLPKKLGIRLGIVRPSMDGGNRGCAPRHRS